VEGTDRGELLMRESVRDAHSFLEDVTAAGAQTPPVPPRRT